MTITRSSRFGASTLALALAFGAVWALTGCSPSETTPTRVLGEQVERTTSTTAYVPPTTTTVYVPPTTTTTQGLSPADLAYTELIIQIPVLARNTRADVEDMLGVVCETLDDEGGDFEAAGSVIVASSVGSFDFDYADAGTILGAAVVIRCPEWTSAGLAWSNS